MSDVLNEGLQDHFVNGNTDMVQCLTKHSQDSHQPLV